MPDIWYISDHHLMHKRALELTDVHGCLLRPEFDNVEQMNEHIIQAHNELVKEKDTVWFLGDVIWKQNQEAKKLLSRFKGKLKLCPGNHDDIKWLCSLNIFDEVVLWKKFPEHDFMLSHVPLARRDMLRTKFNVHGHLHEKDVLDQFGTPDLHFINVCVEQTGYMPVSLDELKLLHLLD